MLLCRSTQGNETTPRCACGGIRSFAPNHRVGLAASMGDGYSHPLRNVLNALGIGARSGSKKKNR
jgi:hypothetical protein